MTNKWIRAAGIRAIKTVAQAAIAAIGSSVVLEQVDWRVAVSTAILAGLLSLLTSVAGLPELKDDDKTETAEIAEADAVASMVTDQPTTDADLAAEKENGGAA
jgi:hypothetical protein